MKVVISTDGIFCLTYQQMQWLLDHNVQGEILIAINEHFDDLQAEIQATPDEEIDIRDFNLYNDFHTERTNPLLIQMLEECPDENLKIVEAINSDRYRIRYFRDDSEWIEVPEDIDWTPNKYYEI